MVFVTLLCCRLLMYVLNIVVPQMECRNLFFFLMLACKLLFL